MARQLGILVFAIALTSIVRAQAGVGASCSKDWQEIPEGTYNQGFLVSSAISEESTKAKLKFRDINGNLIKEVETPRSKIDAIFENRGEGEGIFYSSAEKLYHFDPKTGNEYELKGFKGKQPCFSATSSVVASCESDHGSVYDMKSKKTAVLPGLKRPVTNGQTVVYSRGRDASDKLTKISIYDFSNSQQIDLENTGGNGFNFTSKNLFQVFDETGTSKSFLNVDAKWAEFKTEKNSYVSGILNSGEVLVAKYQHKSKKDVAINLENLKDFNLKTEILDRTGKVKKGELKGIYMKFSENQPLQQVSFNGDSKVIMEKDLKNLMAGKSVKPLAQGRGFSFSDKGNWLLVGSQDQSHSILANTKTGKTLKIPFVSDYPIITESANGENLKIRTPPAGIQIVNTRNGKVRRFTSNYLQFDENFEKWFDYNGRKKTVKTTCLPDSVQVIDDDCNCLFKNTDQGDALDANLKDLGDLSLQALCQGGFDEKEWDKVTPPVRKGQISQKQAGRYLKRFQRKGGFDSQKHLPILTAILSSEMVEKSPYLVNEALKNLTIENPGLTSSLSRKFKLSKRIPPKFSEEPSQSCKTPVEEMSIANLVYELSNQASAMNPGTTASWEKFRPFKNDIQKLPASQREAIVDGIAESLSQGAGNSADLRGIFQSKMYYFSKKYALELTGEAIKPTTDLTFANRGGAKVPIVLGSEKLSGGKKTAFEDVPESDETLYGFHYQLFDDVKVGDKAKTGDVQNKKYTWEHGGEKYSADAKVKVMEPLDRMISKSKTPDYKALKKDGKLTGMMIVGANLSTGSGWLIDGYISYYQNAGFEFKEAKSVDAISFFKDSVKSGEVDYLIKEAHSDGDEKNLFRANKYGRLYEGTLKKKDGTTEVIYLMTPDADKRDSKLISNQEFGQWTRARGKDSPLVYFNASCGSSSKVISEVAAAHSKNLVPIATISSVRTFSPSPHNGTHEMLEAFRSEKNYDGIRSALHNTTNYKKGEDHYIFPDEESYDTFIRKNLKMNVDIELSVKDKDGNELHIDENIEH